MEGKKKKYAENRIKNKCINIRTDEVHYNKFKQLAGEMGLNINSLVEQVIDNGFQQPRLIISPSLEGTYKKFEEVVKPIANNLNQITKAANASGNVDYEKLNNLKNLSNNINRLIEILETKDRYILEVIKEEATNNSGAV